MDKYDELCERLEDWKLSPANLPLCKEAIAAIRELKARVEDEADRVVDIEKMREAASARSAELARLKEHADHMLPVIKDLIDRASLRLPPRLPGGHEMKGQAMNARDAMSQAANRIDALEKCLRELMDECDRESGARKWPEDKLSAWNKARALLAKIDGGSHE